jgi:hypothetical protein
VLRAAHDGAPPPYEEPYLSPAPAPPPPPPGRRAAREAALAYDEVKEPPADTLDLRRLGSLLRRQGEAELLRMLRSMRRPDLFRAEFLADPGATQPGARRRTMMAPHLWAQLETAGVVERVPRLARGAFTCALRLVPDRKAARRARVIFPVCPLNEACRRPPPTPTPHLHQLIADTLQREWAVSADLKGWFFSLGVPRAVAQRYFGLIGPSGPAVARRGLLGWTFMPAIMARIALALATQAERLSRPAADLTRRVWIDNYVVSGDSREDLAAFMRQLRLVAGSVRAELHEVTSPASRLVAVGVEMDLRAKRWRLNPAYPAKFAALATQIDAERVLPVRTIWRAAGAAVWTAYALALPLTWVGPALRYVAALAQRFQSGAVAADDVTPFPRAVRDSIRAAATQACRNPWRSLAASIGRPVYSDACGSGGCGAVVPAAVGYREVAWRDASGEHINVLEAKAALGALRLSAPPPRGAAVPVVVDNTCVAYQLLRGRGRPAAADDAVRAAYEWAARHGVGLQPVIVPTDCQPADEASRARQPYDKSVVTPPGVRGASLRPRPPPIAVLPVGWRRPVTQREFAKEASRALRRLLPRASPSPRP